MYHSEQSHMNGSCSLHNQVGQWLLHTPVTHWQSQCDHQHLPPQELIAPPPIWSKIVSNDELKSVWLATCSRSFTFSRWSTVAPWSINILAMTVWPYTHAQNRAVFPSWAKVGHNKSHVSINLSTWLNIVHNQISCVDIKFCFTSHLLNHRCGLATVTSCRKVGVHWALGPMLPRQLFGLLFCRLVIQSC